MPRIGRVLARLGLASLVALVVFIAAIYVQDVLQGDLRLPVGCVDEGGELGGCPHAPPRPDPGLAAAFAVAGGLIAFRLLKRFFRS